MCVPTVAKAVGVVILDTRTRLITTTVQGVVSTSTTQESRCQTARPDAQALTLAGARAGHVAVAAPSAARPHVVSRSATSRRCRCRTHCRRRAAARASGRRSRDRAARAAPAARRRRLPRPTTAARERPSLTSAASCAAPTVAGAPRGGGAPRRGRCEAWPAPMAGASWSPWSSGGSSTSAPRRRAPLATAAAAAAASRAAAAAAAARWRSCAPPSPQRARPRGPRRRRWCKTQS